MNADTGATHAAPDDGVNTPRPRLVRRLLRWLVVAFVIYVVAGLAMNAWMLSHLRIGSPVRSTQAQMRQIEAAVKAFHNENGRLPAGLHELAGPNGHLDAEEVPRDAWDGPFHYAVVGPAEYELISRGADGVPGGEGEDADLRRSDLRRRAPSRR